MRTATYLVATVLALTSAGTVAQSQQDKPVVVAAYLQPTGFYSGTIVRPPRYQLYFTAQVTANQPVYAADKWVMSFRDLFTLKMQAQIERPIGEPIEQGQKKKVEFAVSASELKLKPGPYHVRLDLVREGKSLCDGQVGSAQFYVRGPNESLEHAQASMALVQIRYVWDPFHQIYYARARSLPPTIDPFDKATRKQFLNGFITVRGFHPELIHDGGDGFRLSAKLYRQMGELTQARFCEQVLRNIMGVIFNYMADERGRIHAVHYQDDTIKQSGIAGRNNTTWTLKLIAQTSLHFRNAVGNTAYADRLLEQAQPIADWEMAQPLYIGCGGDKVYDGRVLAGQAWYLLAEKARSGTVNPKHFQQVIDFAVKASEHAIAHNGWYDNGDVRSEGGCHIWYGNMNLLSGLTAAYKLLAESPNPDPQQLATIEKGMRRAFWWLTNLYGTVTGHPVYTAGITFSSWSQGVLWEAAQMYLEMVGPDYKIEYLQQALSEHKLSLGWPTGGRKIHGYNMLGATLGNCPEYRKVIGRPIFWRSGERGVAAPIP